MADYYRTAVELLLATAAVQAPIVIGGMWWL
jgi:hypothetical protein